MKKMLLILLAIMFCFAIFTGCVEENENLPKEGDTRLISEEPTGGTYNASILYKEKYYDGSWHNFTGIKYTKDGKEYTGAYLPYMRDALNWIKSNTTENITVLCWWDYGHMIEGYAERNAIAVFPSLALKDTIAEFFQLDETGKQRYREEHEWDANKTLEDISNVLTSTNISNNETWKIIQRYNVSFILTTGYDKLIAKIFFDSAGKNSDDYIITGTHNPTEKGMETLIFQMWENYTNTSGLELRYEYKPFSGYYDVKIFELIIFYQ